MCDDNLVPVPGPEPEPEALHGCEVLPSCDVQLLAWLLCTSPEGIMSASYAVPEARGAYILNVYIFLNSLKTNFKELK